jgi:antitoxin component of MazEF toxin-antitoxin module
MKVKFGLRRLQKSGTSYVISIPPQWINSIGAGKGAAFNIEMDDDNSLRIIPN